jgi:hypothetical protein
MRRGQLSVRKSENMNMSHGTVCLVGIKRLCVVVAVLSLVGCGESGEQKPVTEQTGKFVINPQFDRADSFSEGLASVRVGDYETGKFGFIDKQGRMVINPQFDGVEPFSEGLAAVRIGDKDTGKWGFIDKQGQMVIDPQFDRNRWDPFYWKFSEGLAPVRIGDDDTGKYGFIDKQGQVVINPQFSYALTFSEGLAAVAIGRKWGFIDKQGRMVINPQFDEARFFKEGLAEVRIGDDETGKWGFIDKHGQMVINAVAVGDLDSIEWSANDSSVDRYEPASRLASQAPRLKVTRFTCRSSSDH